MEELNPCPFCGCDCLYVVAIEQRGYDTLGIFCNNCKQTTILEENEWEGNNDTTRERAIKAWNRRASDEQKEKVTEAVQMAVEALKRETSGDAISRHDAIDALMEILDRPNHAEFLYTYEICKALNELPSAQPQRTCVNCGRTANNGGWYADGRTRCPIEEHYALPKDGYCHLWEKRNVTDDDYPERREE